MPRDVVLDSLMIRFTPVVQKVWIVPYYRPTTLERLTQERDENGFWPGQAEIIARVPKKLVYNPVLYMNGRALLVDELDVIKLKTKKDPDKEWLALAAENPFEPKKYVPPSKKQRAYDQSHAAIKEKRRQMRKMRPRRPKSRR